MVARKTNTENGSTIEKEKSETVVTVPEVAQKAVIEVLERNMTVEVKKPTIYTELTRIQQTLNAPKNQRNKFGNYNYRSAEDIVEAYKKVQGETSLVVSDEINVVGDRYYIKATATLYYGGESIFSTAFAREPLDKKGMDDSQITGAASSYARKYAMNGLFCIDDNKDPDTMSPDDNTATKRTPNKEAELLATFTKMFEECKNLDQLREVWNNTPENLKPKAKNIKDARKLVLENNNKSN